MAAPAPPQPANTNPKNDTNKDKETKSKVKEDRPPLSVPSHGTTGSEGAAADWGVVMGEVHEARGNLRSLRGSGLRWEVKLGRCRDPGDVPGGIAGCGTTGGKVSEGKHRLREAQRAVEELEGKWARMGTRDDGVEVEEVEDDNVQLVNLEGHP